MSEEYAIELKNITKRFGKVTANDKVCLSVKRGEKIGRASCRERV